MSRFVVEGIAKTLRMGDYRIIKNGFGRVNLGVAKLFWMA